VMEGTRGVRAALVMNGKMAASRGDEVSPASGSCGESSKILSSDNPDPHYPICLRLRNAEDREVGTILLGPRPDGSLYGKAEREALTAVAAPIGRAISIVQLRDAAKQEQADALRQLRAEVAMLKSKLVSLATPGGRSRRRHGE
jgi:hypothetical protein